MLYNPSTAITLSLVVKPMQHTLASSRKIHYIIPTLVELAGVDVLKLPSHFLFHSLYFFFCRKQETAKRVFESNESLLKCIL